MSESDAKKTSVYNSTTEAQLTANAKKREMALSSLQSLTMADLEYWQSKERLHRLRSETSMPRLQLKQEQREAGSAHMDEKRFHQFRTKAASNS